MPIVCWVGFIRVLSGLMHAFAHVKHGTLMIRQLDLFSVTRGDRVLELEVQSND